MEIFITEEKAMQLLDELIKSGEEVTQDAVEEIISKLSVVDSKVTGDTTTILYTGKISLSNYDELRYIGHTEAYEFCLSRRFKDILTILIRESNNLSVMDEKIANDLADAYLNGMEKFELADQTDIQNMILAENMSAFGQEENVFAGVHISGMVNESDRTNQIFVDSLASK